MSLFWSFDGGPLRADHYGHDVPIRRAVAAWRSEIAAAGASGKAVVVRRTGRNTREARITLHDGREVELVIRPTGLRSSANRAEWRQWIKADPAPGIRRVSGCAWARPDYLEQHTEAVRWTKVKPDPRGGALVVAGLVGARRWVGRFTSEETATLYLKTLGFAPGKGR